MNYTRIALLLGLCLAGSAHAQAPAEMDSRALGVLETMGRYLHALPHYALSAESATDQTLETGQVVEFHHRTDVLTVHPDKLHVSVDQGTSARQFFYDGKSFTLYDGHYGYYTNGPAPATIDALLDDIADRYGIELPLSDLFRWGPTTAKDVGISEALVIGDERLGAYTCTHYAYRQPDIDWQLWVRTGPDPLPCRLVITRRDTPELPRHSVDFNWDLKAQIPANTFTFIPPAKAQQVPLRVIQAPVPAPAGEQP
ncbi:MAG: DUF2092 domain-containing protein [Pseudomonas sp.]|uniref:DUF2092 domain-containing protein n=1 Tax=Pseudomonas abieticivorans TaxID=2931382 RepID=UPI0020BEA278|nr:DUF2092 domain-containing protein [Pseudomonas sp. PIA16]MDE1167314.1 DUF2092 domain-containing protein [Pseudomonas sp.]